MPKKTEPKPRRLTGKQEAWCRWMVSAEVNFNGTEAARRAGYAGRDTTLRTIARDNHRKPHVAARLEQLKEKALSGANITIEKVLRDLEVSRAQAHEAGQHTAAIRASELQGKYLKMFTERIEHVQSLEDITDRELAGLIRELAENGNLDLSDILGLALSDHLGRTAPGDGPEDRVVSGSSGAQRPH